MPSIRRELLPPAPDRRFAGKPEEACSVGFEVGNIRVRKGPAVGYAPFSKGSFKPDSILVDIFDLRIHDGKIADDRIAGKTARAKERNDEDSGEDCVNVLLHNGRG